MRQKILLATLILSVLARLPLFAQLAAPNESGISLGHVHLLSRDPDAQTKIWVEAFGAQMTKTGTLELLRLPGIFIIINKAEPSAGSVGSTVDHIAFSVKDAASMKSKLASIDVPVNGPFVSFPDNLRVELLEEKSQTLPLVMHHIHIAQGGSYGIGDPGVTRSHQIDKSADLAAHAFFFAAHARDRQKALRASVLPGESFVHIDKRPDQTDVSFLGLRGGWKGGNTPVK